MSGTTSSAPQGAAGPAGHTSAPSKGAQSGRTAFSSAARKDPALLPLAVIMGGIVATAAYFFSTKSTGVKDPAKQFAPISQPWHGNDKEGSSLYKYRYLAKNGKVEHHQPATSYETVPITGNIDRLRKYNVPHDEQK